MPELKGYQLKEKIFESHNSIVYRGEREKNGGPVVIKLMKNENPSLAVIEKFEYEFKIGKKMDGLGTIKYYSLENYRNSKAIVMEDFGGESLDQVMKKEKLDLRKALRIANLLTDTIGEIHKKQIVHKDIKPHNILLNKTMNRLSIIDFSIAIEVSREYVDAMNTDQLEGTLAYIAPEQTGRMNRSVDYRSDFYSMGVTLYELLTSRLPFDMKDVLELVHAHMALVPERPSKLNSEIPEVLSDIVMKLLEKMAENRYQSTMGIKVDLERCYQELMEKGKIERFEIGTKDISEKFIIPEKLYGREKEVELLFNEFRRASQGEIRILFVSGPSGIGKSYLINELKKPLVKERGYFISGKFDRFKRNIPYSSVIQAIQELIRQILTESEKKIKKWKEEITAALGNNGQVVADVIPELELIIGKQPEVATLNAAEAQNRFNYIFQNFISMFAKKEHPLVMFLDDLQWADSASLQWLKMILKNNEMGYFLFIGSYRDMEIEPHHPLNEVFENLTKSGNTLQTILIKSLDEQSITEMTGDTVRTKSEEVTEISKIIFNKTGGNPFFVTEFLKRLYVDGIVYFDNGWKWDKEKMATSKMTENVVEFMTEKLKKLPAQSQNILKNASLQGVKFYLDTLSKSCGLTEDKIIDHLKGAINDGMIMIYEKIGRFAHDRIQESAYSLIQEQDKPYQHYQLGKIMLEEAAEANLEDRVFAILHQLNRGLDLMQNEEEKLKLAELNLKAGRKAKASIAFLEAKEYFETALKLLPEDPWKKQYELTLGLNTEMGEVSYLNGNFETAENYFDAVIHNGKTILEKVMIYERRIGLYTSQMKYKEGFKTAMEAFALLKIKFPKNANILNVITEILSLRVKLSGKKIEDLLKIKKMEDPLSLARARVLSIFLSLTYIGYPNYFPIVVCKLVRLSLKHGNSVYSPLAYVVFGLIICNVLGDIRQGNKFGNLGIQLLEIYQDKTYQSITLVMNKGMTAHWNEHLRNTQPHLLKAIELGREVGDLQIPSYAIVLYLLNSFLLGENLETFKARMLKYHPLIQKMHQEDMILMFDMFLQMSFTLTEPGKQNLFQGAYFNELEAIPLFEKTNKQIALFSYAAMTSLLFYLNGQYEKSIQISEKYEKYKDTLLGTSLILHHYFLNSLVLLAQIPLENGRRKRQYYRKLDQNISRLKKWAAACPGNTLHKLLLVQAEKAQLNKNPSAIRVLKIYDRAIDGAHQNEYKHDEAIANERAGRFCLAHGLEKSAMSYLIRAYRGYSAWGAKFKTLDMMKEFPDLLEMEIAINENTSYLSASQTTVMATETSTGVTRTSTGQLMDLATIMKASQAISGEIVMDRLLGQLTKILMENVGAEKTVLILSREGQFKIEAVAQAGKHQVEMIKIDLTDGNGFVPDLVTNYVSRRKESLVLNNAGKDGDFVKDPYIIKNQVRSILCSPIINQGNLVGLVYLENNRATGAFTMERLELLKMLLGQMGISLDNAKLYEKLEEYSKNLEKKVDERTAALNSANKELTQKQEQIMKEMNVARRVQMSLVPTREKLPKSRQFDLSSIYMPMEDIGGDLFDIIPIDEKHFGFMIADVSGHGVPSALITTMIKTSFNYRCRPGLATNEIITQINDEMVGLIGDLEHYFTAFFGILNTQERTFEYTTAGHPAALLYREKKKQIEELDEGGTVMGSFSEIQFAKGKVKLEAGDGIILYTDGIVEARNENDDFFKLERLKKVIFQSGSKSTEEFTDQLEKGDKRILWKQIGK